MHHAGEAGDDQVDGPGCSIYGVWRSVLEYFDAHVVGLTATPGKQTFGLFRQKPGQ